MNHVEVFVTRLTRHISRHSRCEGIKKRCKTGCEQKINLLDLNNGLLLIELAV